MDVANLLRSSLPETLFPETNVQLGLSDPVGELIRQANPKNERILAGKNLRVRNAYLCEPIDLLIRQAVDHQ